MDRIDITSLILDFSKQHAGMTVAYLLLVVAVTVLEVLLVSRVIASLQKSISQACASSTMRNLVVVMAVLACCLAVGWVTDFVENKLFPKFVAFAETRMAKLILEKNQVSPTSIDANIYRQLMQRTSSSAAHVYQQVLYSIVPASIVLLVLLGYCFVSSWIYGLVFLVVLALAGLAMLAAKPGVLDMAKQQEVNSKRVEWRVFDVMANIPVVVSKNMVANEQQRIAGELHHLAYQKNAYLQRVENLGYLVKLVTLLGVFVVLAISVFKFAVQARVADRPADLSGQKQTTSLPTSPTSPNATSLACQPKPTDQMTTSMLMLLSVLLGVRSQFASTTKSLSNMMDSMGKYQHIEGVADSLSKTSIKQGQLTSLAASHAALQFVNIGFKHAKPTNQTNPTNPAGQTSPTSPTSPTGMLVENVNFMVVPGQPTVIQGKSGSGKSTLAKMCVRNVEPVTGQVLLGQHDIREYDLVQLRSMVSLVNPDQTLFNETLLYNMVYGSQSDQAEATALALFEEFKPVFQNRLASDQAGAQGSALSTGQKMLIRLINLFVSNQANQAQVLIFDEPTSGLDDATKQLVIKMIAKLGQTKTVLVITHDSDCTSLAKQLFVLENCQLKQVAISEPKQS